MRCVVHFTVAFLFLRLWVRHTRLQLVVVALCWTESRHVWSVTDNPYPWLLYNDAVGAVTHTLLHDMINYVQTPWNLPVMKIEPKTGLVGGNCVPCSLPSGQRSHRPVFRGLRAEYEYEYVLSSRDDFLLQYWKSELQHGLGKWVHLRLNVVA